MIPTVIRAIILLIVVVPIIAFFLLAGVVIVATVVGVALLLGIARMIRRAFRGPVVHKPLTSEAVESDHQTERLAIPQRDAEGRENVRVIRRL